MNYPAIIGSFLGGFFSFLWGYHVGKRYVVDEAHMKLLVEEISKLSNCKWRDDI